MRKDGKGKDRSAAVSLAKEVDKPQAKRLGPITDYGPLSTRVGKMHPNGYSGRVLEFESVTYAVVESGTGREVFRLSGNYGGGLFSMKKLDTWPSEIG